jgi:DNA-binding response OmpR family regulator
MVWRIGPAGRNMAMNRILLVEDDILSNQALSRFLQDAGYEVDVAYCGLAALEAIKCAPPHLLVTDVNLGTGPDGFEVARYARWRCPAVRVVYMSSKPPRLSSDLCDGSRFVPKPYRAEQILEALRGSDRPTAAAA